MTRKDSGFLVRRGGLVKTIFRFALRQQISVRIHTNRPTLHQLKILITREQIAAKVAELGARISGDFAGQPVLLVGVLKGSAIFLADLAREISLDVSFDFIAVSSYGNRTESGELKLIKDVEKSLEGRNVILVEDILDTGVTAAYIRNLLLARKPTSFKIVSLLDKPGRR